MNEVHGITEIDSIYEALGLQAAGRIAGLFLAVHLPLLILLCSTAWLVFKGAERGSFRNAIVHLTVTALLWFLLGPVTVVLPGRNAPMRFDTPRLLHTLNSTLDHLMAAATDDFDALRRDVSRDRVAFLLRELRISSPSLVAHTESFLHDCTEPEIVAREEEGLQNDWLMLPLMVRTFERLGPDLDRACRTRHAELRASVNDHLSRRREIHKFVTDQDPILIDLIHLLGLNRKLPVSDYLTNVAVARVWSSRISDMARAERVTGGSGLSLILDERHNDLPVPRTDAATTAAIHGYSRAAMSLEVRARRYEVMMHAPRFYGLALMLAIAAFPIAALWALLPSGWIALAHFGKVFVSIKLWPLFWHLLSIFNDVTAEPDARLVLPAIYGIIPVVSFVFVNIVAGASSHAFRQVTDPGPSPVGAAQSVALGTVTRL